MSLPVPRNFVFSGHYCSGVPYSDKQEKDSPIPKIPYLPHKKDRPGPGRRGYVTDPLRQSPRSLTLTGLKDFLINF